MLSWLARKIHPAALDRQAAAVARTARAAIMPKSSGVRMFKAGTADRLSESWNPSGYNVDSALRLGLRRMRNRSREQFYNNEYAKRFYGLLKSNVIGHAGIALQVKALAADGRLDTVGNRAVEKAWKKWCNRGSCDVTRKLSFIDLLKIALETTARDGEVFIRKVKGFPNAFRFALQLLEADLVDENLNTVLANGNKIRMGVEFDSWDAPVAYWILKNHPGDYLYGYTVGTHERIPAEEIIHLYAPEFVRQSRGFPWGHAAMSRLRKIDKYEEAEVTAAYGAAAKMGFYEVDPAADPEEYVGEDGETAEELLSEFDPFTIEKLPPGYKFKAWDPQHPAGNYDPFMSRMLRAVASGFMLSYHSLCNDRGDANYGSQRGGTLEDRDVFKTIQTWLCEWLLEDVFREWLPYAVLTGNCQIPPSDMPRYGDGATWKPRRWDWIDPLKDVTAKIKEMDAGLTTATSIVSEKGEDIEDLYQEKQQEMQLETTYGVTLGTTQKGGESIAITA
uniref:Phage portal protein n=1 Tax=Geobacter metallireducens TaxID=28232 RepID=A0A831XL27_GEOME